MKELIQIAEGFQTSINIAFDLNNDDKIRGFIPTMSSLEVFEDILLSTVPNSTQRARILIGAYGRGKSHIVLVLMSLLYRKGDESTKLIFHNLLEKFKNSNSNLFRFATEYIKGKQKILPIVVRGSSTSLAQSFLSALSQTLNDHCFADIMPETHFKAAVNQIEKWKNEYPDTYNKLLVLLSKSVNDFKLALSEFDVRAYDEFVKIYPMLTSGSVFNPFLGFDVVELYENVAIKLKDKGYCGVYVIYDEFSKYLESSIASATNSDIKLLQDFAEKCNRSGNAQMHLMLISHKDIANYIDNNLQKDKVDGWRGVSGRFKHIQLHNNYSQMYEIISAVINKNPLQWDRFTQANRMRFDNLKDRFIKNGLLDKNNPNEITTAVQGCFPLHTISTFILPRLSEKIAQNERTLFTFLSSDEKHTLPDFISAAKNFELLTPDYIYDYFEPLLKKEPYTSEVHKIYRLTTGILRKIEGKPLHEKIIKTLSLIYIVEQFEKLPPVVDIIVDAYRDSVDSTKEIDQALKELIDNDCVVYLKRSNNYLKIKESSGVDISEEIDRYKNQRLSGESVTKILNESLFDSFIYPTAYNDENDIIRYFDFLFIESREFLAVKDWEAKIAASNADGTIYAIVPESFDEIEKLSKKIIGDKKSNNRIVFILPKNWVDISKDVFDYAAVMGLRNEAAVSGDEVLHDEYDVYLEDLAEVVRRFINSYSRPENDNATYFYKAKQYYFHRRAQLSALLSKICEDLFNKMPVINNESINKNELSTTAINSRTKILTGLLANDLAPNIGLSGNGQEVSIMRSTLIITGVLEQLETNPRVQLRPDSNPKMKKLLAEISNFFTVNASTGTGAIFQELYDILRGHSDGFGIKKGVIPIYIALVLHVYKDNLVVLHHGNEVKITPELLNDINESPGEYSVILEDWNEEKAAYLAGLEKLFGEYVSEREKVYNRFTYIFLAMNRWYLSLPKFAKELAHRYSSDGRRENIGSEKKRFINLLKQMNTNPRDFLFTKVFEIFRHKSLEKDVLKEIEEIKIEYDAALNNLVSYLIWKIKAIFAKADMNATLSSVVRDWYDTLTDNTRHYLFTGNENKILELFVSVKNDEFDFVQRLAKSVAYLRIEDWNDDTVEVFLRDLAEFKNTVDDYNKQKQRNKCNTTSYEIIITNDNGERIPKRFDRIEYTPRAKLLRNEISNALEEMGRAITEQEKRQVLVELLEALC